MTNNNRIPPGSIARITGKLVCEPQRFTYNGPKASYSGLGIFGGYQTRVSPQQNHGLKTKSREVFSILIAEDSNITPEEISSMRLNNLKLQKFQEMFSDPTVEANVERFHTALQNKLATIGKRSRVSQRDVEEVVEYMKPYNLGLIAKYQLVVTKVSVLDFDKSSKSEKTGQYYRTVKSKQAYKMLADDVDAEFDQIERIWADTMASVSNVSVTPDVVHYTVKDVRKNGMTYKRLEIQDV